MTVPPRSTESLLESLGARADFRDALLGDMAEEFALRAARDGEPAARRWYRGEALRTAPHLVRDWARHLHARDLAHLAGVAFTAWVLLQAVLGLVVVPVLFAALAALDVAPRAIVVRQMPWEHPLGAAAALAGGTLVAAVGGRIAAALHGRAPLVGALALGVAWTAFGSVVAAFVQGMPLWYRVAGPAVMLAGATIGGLVAVRAAGARDQSRDAVRAARGG